MKGFRRFFTLFLCLSILFICYGCENKKEPASQKVKIGVLLPLTGPLAAYGQRVKKGIDLAAEHIRSSEENPALELVVMDSKADPKVGLSAFRQMVDLHGINYVQGDVSSSVTLAITPLLVENRVLMISPAASSRDLTGASPLFARMWPTDDLEATAVANYALKQGCSKFATLAVNVDYGIGLQQKFEEIIRKNGGEIVLSERFPLNNREYRVLWEKVASASPQCLYFVGHKPEIIAAFDQYGQAGLKIPIFGNTNFEDQDILKIVGDVLEGAVFGTATLESESKEEHVRNFVKEFREKYNEAPTLYSANGYDITNLLYELAKRYNANVEAAMSDIKSRENISGAAGNFHFEENGNVVRPIAIKKIEQNKYVTIGFF